MPSSDVENALEPLGVSEEQDERYYSRDARADMPLSDFGDPDKRAFPIKTQTDVDNAARLIGHADNPDAVKKRIISIATRKGLRIPDAWKANNTQEQVQESVEMDDIPSHTPRPFVPKPRVATFTTTFLSYDAISQNGRQYPQQVCDEILQSAQRDLADPNALPITCHVSHQEAIGDNSLALVGRVTRVWQEGRNFLAQIDVPDTHAGRDMASLAAYRYIGSQSMRVCNVETYMQRGKTLPQVRSIKGHLPKLLGIDFTVNPGLADTARISNVVLESSPADALVETFPYSLQESTPMEQEQTKDATLQESDAIPSLASGVTQGVDDSPTQSDYAKRQYTLPPVENPSTNVASGDITESLKSIHDHASSMLGMSCAPMSSESGRTLSKANEAHAVKMHDEAAKALKMQCEGAYQPKAMTKPTGGDGTDDDNMESRKASPNKHTHEESKQMTPEEMAAQLAKLGWNTQRPKTQEEVLQEQVDAKLAAQQKAFEEKLEAQQKTILEAIANNAPRTANAPQRRSQVMESGKQTTEARPNLATVRNTSLLESMTQDSYSQLANRAERLPDAFYNNNGDINQTKVEQMLREMGQVWAHQLEEKWGGIQEVAL